VVVGPAHGQPLVGDLGDGFLGGGLAAARLVGVDPLAHLLVCLIVGGARLGQCDAVLVVVANDERPGLAVDPVGLAPDAGAAGRDVEVEAAVVEHLPGCVFGLGFVLDLNVRQHVRFSPFLCRHRRPRPCRHPVGIRGIACRRTLRNAVWPWECRRYRR
jgi:hypothetical protein